MNDLLTICAVNTYTLFDPLGTNCLEVLKETPDARVAELMSNHILPTWDRVKPAIVRLRSNLGHHAPYHDAGRQHAASCLAALEMSDLVVLTHAVHLATFWTAKAVGERLAMHGTMTRFGAMVEKDPVKFLTLASEAEKKRCRRLLARPPVARGFKPIVALLSNYTLAVPFRLVSWVMCHFSRWMVRNAITVAPEELPDWYPLLREQFITTNSLFLTYYSFVLKKAAVARWRCCLSESMRLFLTHTLLLTWYSHIHTLFEDDRASLSRFDDALTALLPEDARWLLSEAILPEWRKRAGEYRKLRNEVGFHRSRSDLRAGQTHDAFIDNTPAASTTYLMRMLYLFFYVVELSQGRELSTASVPHWVPVDSLFPTHRLSADREYFTTLKSGG